MSTGTGPEADRRLDAPAAGLRAALPDRIGGTPLAPLDPQDPFAGGLELIGGTAAAPPDGVVHEREIRPRRRLRWWQTLPIAVVGILGSLMFAFPLAFESGGGGAVVGMLGLLLTSASVGWGAMAARRVGYTWPGLPRRGSGERAGWRPLAAYTLVGLAAVGLAVWRVALLRG
ncbi:hypothetical protein [Streptacidiphilus sp. ASG 303]|uniref:hypothetical protein n=1 Tax=Streptomycetaceae TaxID=2062 RepID=UPI001E3D3180|nr:hypothetical protein [Streptacidiphilus sp. ASG 303]MCD0484676.1 hypothetical protein [Streptacidiphilus sp. ASG 303]